MSPGTIYAHTPSGHRVCGLCQGKDGAHTAACAVVAMHGQLVDLTAQLALFVATMRETLEGFEALLHGDPAGRNGHGTD